MQVIILTSEPRFFLFLTILRLIAPVFLSILALKAYYLSFNISAVTVKNLFCLWIWIIISVNSFSQSPAGTWKTIDDNTGKEQSYVRIYETKSGNLQEK